MKLFLASEGKHPQSIEKLKNFLDKPFEECSVCYIPTAVNGSYYGAWKDSESIPTVKSMVADLKVFELEGKSRSELEEIKKFDILWVGGGYSGYLLYWVYRSELDKLLSEILESGVTYVGSSAGSMICAPTQYSSEWYLGEPEPGASLLPGLNYIDFEIYPHYSEDQLPEIEKCWKGERSQGGPWERGNKGRLCLLKDGDVVTKVGDKVEVLGEEKFLGV
jgi:dipeptidase E